MMVGFGTLLSLTACAGEDEELRSQGLDEPSIVFDVVPPDVDTDWPDVGEEPEEPTDTSVPPPTGS